MRDTQVGREPIHMSGPKGATGGTFVTRSTERTTLVTRQCDEDRVPMTGLRRRRSDAWSNCCRYERRLALAARQFTRTCSYRETRYSRTIK